MTRLVKPMLMAAIIGLCAWMAADVAQARSSDRNQPMNLSSNQSDCTLDSSGVCNFAGNVQISQGTLDIGAARAELHRASGELNRVVLTGSPVVLTQQLDDGTPMTARASSVDYNLDTEIVVFTGNVEIEQPRGTLSGERVVYNMVTGQVTSGGEGNGRVEMQILPATSGTSSDADAGSSPQDDD